MTGHVGRAVWLWELKIQTESVLQDWTQKCCPVVVDRRTYFEKLTFTGTLVKGICYLKLITVA
jgi:hypothetical protein